MSDWKEKVLENMRRSRAEQGKAASGRWGLHRNPVQLAASLEFLAMVDEAARKVDLNRAAFIRRAVSVVAAKIVDQPVSVFLQETPYAFSPEEVGTLGGGRAPSSHDTGRGIEVFCPHPRCTGEHLLQ